MILLHSESSHGALGQTNMLLKVSGSDAFRVSVSSAPSTSSQGSTPDDSNALGDVYMWGEIICDNVVKFGSVKNSISESKRADVLLPRPLESNVVLDVHHIACGVRHAAVVTRQGEIFSWGEESGGQLGHGVGKDVTKPRLVESLSFCHVDFVACGEFHTCAVTTSGELYTWGDGRHNAGILGQGTDVSHWIPKRISGPLERLHIATVTCGPWHTALISSTGQLFTFGDGTFGVLGHGNREHILYPREVESLAGLRTISVACGVWHTAAVVEVIVTQSSASVSYGKLFTWGDGDKNRLGHGDKESRLKPTCVTALIDYNFHKIACGHNLTVGLTTSGRVFTVGSTVYGQLGNPRSDGKLPCLVEDNLVSESVEEIACGAYHVAVLTSKNEVFTWGNGANGRLGQGDMEDRKMPSLVEALKDRSVKYIACGSNYTAAVCLQKRVSGADQSQCSACRQVFGFSRKRHNCYNCGLVHCHACSSRKALRAALAPNPIKPYRVCDSCFSKLSSRRDSVPRISGESTDAIERTDIQSTKSETQSNIDLIKRLDAKAAKQGKKANTFASGRSSQLHSSSQLRDAVMSADVDVLRTAQKPILTPSSVSSRSVSPFSSKTSPVPTTSGHSFSETNNDTLKKTNEFLNREVHKLRVQVESLRNRCDLQELELQKSVKKAQEAITLAAEESANCKSAKEVIKSLTAQLKYLTERLPSGVYNPDYIKLAHLPHTTDYPVSDGEGNSRSDSINDSYMASHIGIDSITVNEMHGHAELVGDTIERNKNDSNTQEHGLSTLNGTNDDSNVQLSTGRSVQGYTSSVPDGVDTKESGPVEGGDNGFKSRDAVVAVNSSQTETEWIEQYESGVYITLVALPDGTRDLKRVRFSRRRFREHQAETWWAENRERVYERYNVRESYRSSASEQAAQG
ncbi:PH, RCC1 and FYVE domains-containing 1-like [Olea europaea subsp. europaea]|uniref:PH, RCC1 and FYVE domains-containing 1-like n=1 Tax=Olea europaea subsp. europaea TaxID=158383 RepID=A0A8S0THD1_OLEEU|nr:PH, RCC1 and FYVE domains-containing 1-like [Olea europaea subsp. europaea]